MSSEQHYLFKYPKTGLVLLKHYLIKGTLVDFSDYGEDFSSEILCSYWPIEDGATFQFYQGMGSRNGETQGPGDFIDLQSGIETGQYQKIRWTHVLKSGYSLCLMSSLKVKVKTSLVDCADFTLPPNTKAIPVSDTVSFWDNNILKVAGKYNLIMDRPYSLQLNGTGKLMLINISG